MNKKLSLPIFIFSLILSLSSIKAQIFSMDDVVDKYNNPEDPFDHLSDIEFELEQIKIEELQPKCGIKIKKSTSEDFKKHIRNLSGEFKTTKLQNSIKIDFKNSGLWQIVCTFLNLEPTEPITLEKLIQIFNEQLAQSPSEICNFSQTLQDQNFFYSLFQKFLELLKEPVTFN